MCISKGIIKFLLSGVITCNLRSSKMSNVFFGFCSKPVRTKTKQSTDKASKKTGVQYFCACINRCWCQLRILSFFLSSCNSSRFVPISFFASASATSGVRPHLDCMVIRNINSTTPSFYFEVLTAADSLCQLPRF